MDRDKLTLGTRCWATDLDTWGPEEVIVRCKVDWNVYAVERAGGEIVSVDGSNCWPDEPTAKREALLAVYTQFNHAFHRVCQLQRAKQRVESVCLPEDVLSCRIAGPDVGDLADLHVPPLAEVDPEAVNYGAVAGVAGPSDVTRVGVTMP